MTRTAREGLQEPAELGALRDLIEQRRRELDLPGIAVGIVHEDQEHVLCSGVANIDAPLPVDGSTLFMIGSTTKVVTATAALALVEAGELALDTPLQEYFGDYPLQGDRADEITLRHLLTHTAGFEGDVAGGDDDWAQDALARSVAGFTALTQHAPPGKAFSYSNSGLRLAGRLLELRTGESYESAVRRLVLDPLGMSQSFFLPWEVFSRPHAVGHMGTDSGNKVAHTWGLGRSSAPEGGLVSSVTDQLTFARYHLDGTAPSAPPLSEATRGYMQQRQTDAAPPFDGVGLPWLLVDTYGRTTVTHGGNIAGIQLSSLLLLPEAGLAVTTLTNAAGGRALGAEVTNWCLENLAGLAPEQALAAQHRPMDELRQYAGRYDCGTWGLELAPDDGALLATFYLNVADREAVVPPPMRLAFGAEDEVLAPGGGQLFGRFQRGDDGSIVRLLCQGRATHRVSAG